MAVLALTPGVAVLPMFYSGCAAPSQSVHSPVVILSNPHKQAELQPAYMEFAFDNNQ